MIELHKQWEMYFGLMKVFQLRKNTIKRAGRRKESF
jgi:hypothetical protein